MALIFTLFVSIFFHLEALNRDFPTRGHPHCFKHLTPAQLRSSELTHELAYFLPATGKQCIEDEDFIHGIKYCPNKSMYHGYVDFNYSKYRHHLRRHLEYCSQHPDCNCYWPEHSQAAAEISDCAYLLFRDLILTTALSDLLDDFDEQMRFIETDLTLLNAHGLSISFIAKQLHFIDYYHVCQDIDNYIQFKYEYIDILKIRSKLENILEALYPKFLSIYKSCYAKHPSHEIEQEIRFMKFLVNDLSDLEKHSVFSKISHSASNYEHSQNNISEFIISNLETISLPVLLENIGIQVKNNKLLESSIHRASNVKCSVNNSLSEDNLLKTPVFSPQSEILLEQGTIYNSILLYKDAIEILSHAIQHNKSNRNAYIERAFAYFETNQLSLAMQDYETAKKLTVIPPFKIDSRLAMDFGFIFLSEINKLEFSKGLLSGITEGTFIAGKELLPSIWNC